VIHKALWSLEKQAHRGFRGYPVATVAFYGPDDQVATKAAVGIVPAEGAEAIRYNGGSRKTMSGQKPTSCVRSASSSRLTGRGP
jgi:hypothetical protein